MPAIWSFHTLSRSTLSFMFPFYVWHLLILSLANQMNILALSLVKTQIKSSRLKKSLTPSQQHLDRSSSTWSNSLDS